MFGGKMRSRIFQQVQSEQTHEEVPQAGRSGGSSLQYLWKSDPRFDWSPEVPPETTQH